MCTGLRLWNSLDREVVQVDKYVPKMETEKQSVPWSGLGECSHPENELAIGYNMEENNLAEKIGFTINMKLKLNAYLVQNLNHAKIYF